MADYMITIRANDGTSQVFKAIGANATRLGDTLADTGDAGLKALLAIEKNTAATAAALEKVGASAEKAGKATEGFNKGAAAAGAAAASLVVGLGQLGQANINQERQISAIGRLYGDQTDEILDYAEALQESTTFSNDAARAAALQTASLTQNYGFQADQVENLIRLGSDYAALYGIELTDATERLTAAMRGEGEAAEALGLTLNDANVARYAASLGITNYSSGLDEAGRAAVRYALLLEQSSAVEGYAAELAGTRAGQVTQFANSLQDLGQSAGAVLGPVGEVAAIAANYGPSFIVAGGAVGGFVGQIKTASAAVNGFKLGGLAVGAALGPIGIGLGALALGAVAIYKIVDAANDAEEAAARLGATLDQSLGNALVLGVDQNEINAVEADIEAVIGTYDRLHEAAATAYFRPSNDPNALNSATLLQLADDAEFSTDQINQLSTSYSELFNYIYLQSGPNAANASAAFDVLNQQYTTNAIGADTYVEGLQTLVTEMNTVGLVTQDQTGKWILNVEALNAVTAATIEIASAQDMASASLANAVDQQERFGISQRTTIEAQIAALRAGVPGVIAAGENSTPIFEEIDILLGALDDLTAARAELAAEMGDTFRSSLFGDLPSIFGDIEGGFQTLVEDAAITQVQADAMSAAFDRLQSSGASTLEIAVGMADAFGYAGTEAAGLALGLYDAVESTNGVLGLYDAIDSVGGVLTKAEGIASNLFGEGGDAFDGLGPLPDLLNSGAISQQTFNEAVAAGTQIQADNARGQASLNEVRANLLPLLADQTTELANYYEQLANGSDLEVQRALYLGDAANQQKLLNIQAAIYSESIGEIPTQAATQLIVDAAQADPVLKQFLIDTKQITEDPITGQITVNFPNGESMTATITTLNGTLEDLGSLIAEINGLPDPFGTVASGADAATLSTDGLTASTLAMWAAPILPPIRGLGTPDDPALDGTDISGYGGPGRGYPGATPPNIAATPQPGAFPAAVPGAGLGPQLTNQTVTIDYIANTGEAVASIGALDVLTTGLTNGAHYVVVDSDMAQAQGDLAGIQGDVRILDESGATVLVTANDAQALDAMDGVDGQIRVLDEATGTVYVYGNVAEAEAAMTDIGMTHKGLDGRTATLFALGDDASAVGAAAAAGGSFDGINGKSALLFALGDSSGAANAAGAAAAAIYGVDGTTGNVYVQGVDNYSGVIAAAQSIGGSVLSTVYMDIVTRSYKQALSHGGVTGYADGGIPAAANGLVMVGEAGPELVSLPGGSLISPSPASQATARQMRGGGGQSITLNNYGTIAGIEDLAGFIYDGLAQAAAMERASQGGR